MWRKVILLFLLSFLLFPRPALAQERVPPSVVLSSGETVNNDYFAAGSSVTLSGTVNGDAFLAGGNILVDGTVNGDLLAAGGTITISGKVANNIRAIGGQVVFSGEAGRNFSAVAGSVNLASSAKVGGNLALAGGSFSLFSPVPGTINAAGGQITLGNTVGGDVNAAEMLLILTANAKIAGNLTYWSDNPVQIQPGGQVAGSTTRNAPLIPPPAPTRQNLAATLASIIIVLRLIDFISAFALGLILIYLLPIDTREVVRLIREKPGSSAGIGILVFIVTPIVVAILLAIIITIPLALILAALYLIAVYLAKIFVFLLIGGLIIPKAAKWLALLLGLVIYELLLFVPFIAGLVMFLTAIFGLGAIFLEKKDFYRELRGKNLI